jgi:hypothetical protein
VTHIASCMCMVLHGAHGAHDAAWGRLWHAMTTERTSLCHVCAACPQELQEWQEYSKALDVRQLQLLQGQPASPAALSVSFAEPEALDPVQSIVHSLSRRGSFSAAKAAESGADPAATKSSPKHKQPSRHSSYRDLHKGGMDGSVPGSKDSVNSPLGCRPTHTNVGGAAPCVCCAWGCMPCNHMFCAEHQPRVCELDHQQACPLLGPCRCLWCGTR